MIETKAGVFDSEFHRRYVGGDGKVQDLSGVSESEVIVPMSKEDAVAGYRKYVGVSVEEMSDKQILAVLNLL